MEFQTTSFRDLIICKPTVFRDDRGYFFESYNEQTFQKATGILTRFVQDNQSQSQYGVIRGLHIQIGVYGQAKLVRCLQGKILDVVVDMRLEEPTFGQYFALELSEENNLQLFIPRGFAHGFSVLSPTAVFSYKCDNFYNKEAELCVAYNDSHFSIDWKIPQAEQILSEKDKNGLDFNSASQKIRQGV
ncbi:MAG TPA: dTDP-4-dehydrorhamnose 3,5-epimerase [Flavobacteriaceae bacterium]|nr:dTDP-4-dehydrorhamnose 3,5-epimerase [Flavobacteriaceae bacterium]